MLSPSLFGADSLKLFSFEEGAGGSSNLRQHGLFYRGIIFKELDCLDESAIIYCHNQVYGVEVFFAIKTSCQVGFMIGGCMEVEAQRAAEPEHVMCLFRLQVEQGDDRINGDFIS